MAFVPDKAFDACGTGPAVAPARKAGVMHEMRLPKTRSAAATALLAAISISACADVNDDDPSTVALDEEVSEKTDAIRLGTEGGSAGAVEIQTSSGLCSGAVFGERMIVTASHCFDSVLPGSGSGTINVRLNYAITGTTWACMNGSPSNGKCSSASSVRVYRDLGPVPDWDIAIIVPANSNDTWQNMAGHVLADGFYTGPISVGTWYRQYGAGYYHHDGWGAGTMRYLTEQIDGAHGQYLDTTTNSTRVCKGDSGGPLYLNGSRWAFGIHSGSSQRTGECVTHGYTARATAYNADKRWLINTWRDQAGISRCVEGDTDFWTCP